ncbi:MAG TPA: DUF4257 domain-containing protein [Alphaproteobacteria bacterium]|nr:DUF4257 domain-containing protein [Alphaproteobacteria bacterium]
MTDGLGVYTHKQAAVDGLGLSAHEKLAVIVNGIALIGLIVLAGLSASAGWLLLLVGSVGGLGGLAHEFAQSKGKIVFFQRCEDGVYLGSLAGVFLGAVAALLTVRGYLTEHPTIDLTQLSYEGFLAGLALKGIAEAACGTTVLSSPSPPASPAPPAPSSGS